MVQTYQSPVRVYQYPFELVMRAYDRRFPTCKMIPIFVGSEILSEFKSNDGAVHIVERRCKLNPDAPYLLKKIAGVEFVYFIQKNNLDMKGRTLKIEARNETFASRIGILEGCTYSVHPDNPGWTIFEQTASLEVKSFFGFENTVEKIAAKQYAANIKKGKEVLLYYIQEILAEGETNFPTWSELHGDENGEEEESEETNIPVIKENENFSTPKRKSTVIKQQSEESNSLHPFGKQTAASLGITDCSIIRNRLASSTMAEQGGAVEGATASAAEEASKVDEDYIKKFLGDLTPLQESRLIQLREWLSETHKGKMPKDSHLLRFLRARDFNTEKAHEMITASLAWRKQHKVDQILSTWEPPPILLDYFPGGWHFYDREGRPVFIMRLGQLDVKGLIKAVGEEAILRHVLSINEEGIRRTEQATKQTGRPISSWTCIVDCEGLSMRHLWRPGIKALLRMIEVVEANYPEVMGKLLIVRAPRVFPVIWTLVSPFIDENTRQKFLIYGGKNYMESGGLTDHIAQQYVPDFICGDCYCDIPEGGIIPKACYRSTDDLYSIGEPTLCAETVYKSVLLQKGIPHEVLVHVKDAQQVLTWDFDVLRGDIVFSVMVSRRPLTIHKEVTNPVSTPAGIIANTVVIDKSMQCGIDYKVVESALVCKAGESIQGSHVCQVAGWYVLQWRHYNISAALPSSAQKAAHHYHKSKIMFYHEVLASEDFRGSMTSLQSCHSGFSSLSISTTSSRASDRSHASSHTTISR
ncbi:SEC14-like protein 1 isoform X2 [Lytechinus variegatus]|uniref:SEC14-like protein 1 isoform X2 n=1 Tax=Lytechinus variegatus TaxID=7654 RepID=UPI001BB1272E|nr:SEC14-like protein 1 isoform X2 [Lytechinus variegatus]